MKRDERVKQIASILVLVGTAPIFAPWSWGIAHLVPLGIVLIVIAVVLIFVDSFSK